MKKDSVNLRNLLLIFSLYTINAVAKDYPKIYPFVPLSETLINKKVVYLVEDKDFISNIFEANKSSLLNAKSKVRPWSSSYWPLNKGSVASPYPSSSGEQLIDYTIRLPRTLSWNANLRHIKKSLKSLKEDWKSLENEDIEQLSPSVKYDLLLGDETFDLTSRLITNMEHWGKNKNQDLIVEKSPLGGKSYELLKTHDDLDSEEFRKSLEYELSSGGLVEKIANDIFKSQNYTNIEDALTRAYEAAKLEVDNYVLVRSNPLISLWEGVCNGWSAAATTMPRPKHHVDFELPNGKRLRFFPEDIKALLSYAWKVSPAQFLRYIDSDPSNSWGGLAMEGLRCNSKNPKRDEWGRTYSKPSNPSIELYDPCAGVHPAVWHLSLLNIIGKQKRSFVADLNIEAEVDNHPVHAYKIEYFNPYTGEYGDLNDSLSLLTKEDQFYKFRNTNTTKIVGVKLTLNFLHYRSPNRELEDNLEFDVVDNKEMLYDLEVNSDGDIIGGQWRTTEVGEKDWFGNRNQPDFIWVILKDWKRFFFEYNNLSSWDELSTTPADWKSAAKYSHQITRDSYDQCKYINKETDETISTPCTYRKNVPQPLANLLFKLLELSIK